jgi:hypothetical protein
VVVALVVLAAVGVCMVAAASLVPAMLGRLGGWPGLTVGFVALVAALTALWAVQKRRDRTLR